MDKEAAINRFSVFGGLALSIAFGGSALPYGNYVLLSDF